MLYVLVLLKNTNVDTKNLHIKIVADPGEHPAHVTKSVGLQIHFMLRTHIYKGYWTMIEDVPKAVPCFSPITLVSRANKSVATSSTSF